MSHAIPLSEPAAVRVTEPMAARCQTVVAEWNGRKYLALIDQYGIAVIAAGTGPLPPEPHDGAQEPARANVAPAVVERTQVVADGKQAVVLISSSAEEIMVPTISRSLRWLPNQPEPERRRAVTVASFRCVRCSTGTRSEELGAFELHHCQRRLLKSAKLDEVFWERKQCFAGLFGSRK